jgi:predicted GH43/DUF377 family glycosyl hydrolase
MSMRSCVIFALMLCVCFGAIAQETWTRFPENPVFNGGSGTVADPLHLSWAFRPAVIYDAQHDAFLGWFSSLTPEASPYTFAFSHAISLDGGHWSYFSKNPVLQSTANSFDAAYLSTPTVVKDAGGYKMYYSGRQSNTNWSIGLATSADGIHWQKYAGSPVLSAGPAGSWDGAFLEQPHVLLVGSTYYLWYMGSNGVTAAIGLATSTDGIVWTKHASNPVLRPGNPGSWDGYLLGEPAVAVANGIFYMMYTAEASASPHGRIGLATSLDGITWQKYANNPVMEPASGWESARIGAKSLLFKNNTFHFWYSGSNGGVWQGGYATSPLTYPPVQNNVVANPGFETGTAPWTFYTNGAGTFTTVSPGYQGTKAAKVAITSPGTNVQLSQLGIPLQPHAVYQLSFDAYSTSGHDISVYLHRNTSPYTNYGVNNFVANLTTGWQHFTLVFTATGFATQTTDTRLRLWMAPYDAAGDQYFLDNISMTKLADGPLAANEMTEPSIPERAAINQNYPNPFNPETTIAFDVPVDSPVRLEVYNIIGQKVATLVDGDLQAGHHRAVFDGSNLSSGTYLYRLTLLDENRAETVLNGRMLLMK